MCASMLQGNQRMNDMCVCVCVGGGGGQEEVWGECNCHFV